MNTRQELLASYLQQLVEDKGREIFTAYQGDYAQIIVCWGEKKREYTFIEYLTKKANDYINEKVNWQGKSKAEDSYNWRGEQTRIAYMINNHLYSNIETAVKEALKNANSVLVKGIEDTVKIKLAEVANSLKVGVSTK